MILSLVVEGARRLFGRISFASSEHDFAEGSEVGGERDESEALGGRKGFYLSSDFAASCRECHPKLGWLRCAIYDPLDRWLVNRENPCAKPRKPDHR